MWQLQYTDEAISIPYIGHSHLKTLNLTKTSRRLRYVLPAAKSMNNVVGKTVFFPHIFLILFVWWLPFLTPFIVRSVPLSVFNPLPLPFKHIHNSITLKTLCFLSFPRRINGLKEDLNAWWVQAGAIYDLVWSVWLIRCSLLSLKFKYLSIKIYSHEFLI